MKHYGLSIEPSMGGNKTSCNGASMMKLNIFAWNQKLRTYVKMGNFGKEDATF